MALLPIVIYPDPRLRQVSQPIETITDEVRQLVRDMAETMYASDGAGLAAIQVGRALRLFILDGAILTQDKSSDPIVFLNPEILSTEGTQEGEEGCLSFPGIFVPIARAETCRVRATSLEGETFELEVSDLAARAVQHETDHLDGKLIIDYVGRLKRSLIERRLRKAQAGKS